MNVKNCFILGAGFGTRMGPIGQYLPKVLWPVYEKTLLELQVELARSWGCKNFYLNCHHQADLIKDFVATKKISVTCIEEKEILNSGGAFHNLKKESTTGSKFIFMNSDIFYLLSKADLEMAKRRLDESKICLFLLRLDQKTNYNKLEMRDGKLAGITPASEALAPYLTYAGLGMIDLDFLEYREGPSRFFETVANYNTREIPGVLPREGDYYDFGTRELYLKQIKEIALEDNNKFRTFFSSPGLLDKQYLDEKNCSYKSVEPNCFEFQEFKIRFEESLSEEAASLYYKKHQDLF